MRRGKALRDLRTRDAIGEAAFQAVESELDILELSADPRVRSGGGQKWLRC